MNTRPNVFDATQGFSDNDSDDVDLENIVIPTVLTKTPKKNVSNQKTPKKSPKNTTKKKFNIESFIDEKIDEISHDDENSEENESIQNHSQGNQTNSIYDSNLSQHSSVSQGELKPNASSKVNKIPKRERKTKNKVSKAKDSTKPKKLKFSKKFTPALKNNADKLLDNMIAWYEQDLKLVAEGKPGVTKMSHLDRVKSILNNSMIHSYLVNNMKFYEAISSWLEIDAETKKLPNMTIRTQLIDILSNFTVPISAYNLRINDLGKNLKYMAKSKLETPKNKKKLNEMLDRWFSELFSIDSKFNSLMKNYEELNSDDDDDKDADNPLSSSLTDSDDAENSGDKPKRPKKMHSTHRNKIVPMSRINPAEFEFNMLQSDENDPNRNLPRARPPNASTTLYLNIPRNDRIEYDLYEKNMTSKFPSQLKERIQKLQEIKSRRRKK